MINVDFEISRLKATLSNKNIDYEDIESICDSVYNSISSTIQSILDSAVDECVLYAESIGAVDFVSKIHVTYDGASYNIGALDGITDFSKDTVEMLPHLLKNAETAEDGSRYKVIPISESQKKPSNIFESMLKRQENVQSQRQQLREKRENRLSDDIVRNAIGTVNDGIRGVKPKKHADAPKQATTNFRTASSKQDPHEKWVIQKRDRDMTSFLMDINNRVNNEIYTAISSIIYEAERGY